MGITNTLATNTIASTAVNAFIQEIVPITISKQTENFEEEKKDYGVLSLFYMILVLFIAAIYFVTMFALWIRVVFYAFKASPLEGISSLLAYKLYNIYKLGTFINAHTLANKV